MAAGDKVTLWWPSANRDESVFDEPFRFDIRRNPNPHVTFGHRSHFCMGANLARMEIRVILDEVLDRLENVALVGPVVRVRTNKHAGVWRVPVEFSVRNTAPAAPTTPTAPTAPTAPNGPPDHLTARN
jgi:cytochrome P450